MSNKNIYMGKIKQILLQDKAGVSQRQIARNLGVNRETVGKYIKAAKADIMGVDGLLGLDETELERRLNGGTAAYSDKRHDELALLLSGIEDEMRRGHKRGVTVKLLWEEYRREHPDGYGLGHKVRYFGTQKLFEHISLARATASVHRCFDQLASTDLIILDDFGLQRLDNQQMLDFMELVEDRHGRKSTIIVSQVPVSDWYEILSANTTAADAILDRLVHSAHRITLKGGSLRK